MESETILNPQITNISGVRYTTFQQSVTVQKKVKSIRRPRGHIQCQSNSGLFCGLPRAAEVNAGSFYFQLPFAGQNYFTSRPVGMVVNHPNTNGRLQQSFCYRLPQTGNTTVPSSPNVHVRSRFSAPTCNNSHQYMSYPAHTDKSNVNTSQRLVAGSSHVFQPLTRNPLGYSHYPSVAEQTGADAMNTVAGYITPSPSPEQLLSNTTEISAQQVSLNDYANASVNSQGVLNRSRILQGQNPGSGSAQNMSYANNVYRYSSLDSQSEAPTSFVPCMANRSASDYPPSSNRFGFHCLRPVMPRISAPAQVSVAATPQTSNRMHSILHFRQSFSRSISNSFEDVSSDDPLSRAYSPVSDTDVTPTASQQFKISDVITEKESEKYIFPSHSVDSFANVKGNLHKKLLSMPEEISLQSNSPSKKQSISQKRKANAPPCIISKQSITKDRFETLQITSARNTTNADFTEPFPEGYLRHRRTNVESPELTQNMSFQRSSIDDLLTSDEAVSSPLKKKQVRSSEAGQEVLKLSRSDEVQVTRSKLMLTESRATPTCILKSRSIKPCIRVKHENCNFLDEDELPTGFNKPLTHGEFNRAISCDANFSFSKIDQTKLEHDSFSIVEPTTRSNKENLNADELNIKKDFIDPFRKRARMSTPTSKPIRMDLLYYANLKRLRLEANDKCVSELPRQTPILRLMPNDKQFNDFKIKPCRVVLTDLNLTLF